MSGSPSFDIRTSSVTLEVVKIMYMKGWFHWLFGESYQVAVGKRLGAHKWVWFQARTQEKAIAKAEAYIGEDAVNRQLLNAYYTRTRTAK